MQAALNFLPLAAFFIAYRVGGIYVATGVLMASMLLLAAIDWLRTRRISTMHAISTALVVVFGTATLLLHDPRFIKWKATALLWLMALAFLGSQFIGRAPFIQRMLEPAMPGSERLARAQWLRLNLAWVVAYGLLGAANLYVAFHASEATWIRFKVFGLTVATAGLAMGQALWLQRRIGPAT
jgi:intracellular septation protein